MRMPPPDGIELARQVRASRVNATTVIVMISGEADRTLMRRPFEAGVEIFLFKPIERNKLLRLMKGNAFRAYGCVAESQWKRQMTVLSPLSHLVQRDTFSDGAHITGHSEIIHFDVKYINRKLVRCRIPERVSQDRCRRHHSFRT
jgi:FixJ family two-component response regulator